MCLYKIYLEVIPRKCSNSSPGPRFSSEFPFLPHYQIEAKLFSLALKALDHALPAVLGFRIVGKKKDVRVYTNTSL